MSDPLVSVVIPVYNGQRFLREALECVFAQDFDDYEVIVVDDGSQDASAEIAGSFPGVHLIRQQNQGPAAARNTGLAAARGQLYANVDADDLLPSGKLTAQAGYLLEHPEVDAVMGRQQFIDPPPWLTRDPVYDELDGIPLTSLVIRTAVLRGLGGYDTSFRQGEDTDLLMRMRERGHEIVVLPDLVVYRRFHGDNLTAEEIPVNPVLRSLRQKLVRQRAAAADGRSGEGG
jgi:glycosyltransferase involved in cell wall biosynthesis